MKNLSKLILPLLIIFVISLIYYTYFKPSEELGHFSRFNSGTEISQEINVTAVKSKGFERDVNCKIKSFYAKDKDNVVMKIELHDGVSDEIINAEVIELMGHLHEKSFMSSRATVIK